MTAEEILKLIETVSLDDTVKLNEIDARVYAFLKLHNNFTVHIRGSAIYYRHNTWPEDVPNVLHHSFQHEKYTRSRDSLKMIRPEGWEFKSAGRLIGNPENSNLWEWNFYHCVLCQKDLKNINCYQVSFDKGKTEELAELHAIIQAIQFERKQNDAA